MQYRKMGSLGWEVSALGFGSMRLPVDEKYQIIKDEAIKMIRYAIEHGVNYVDTAYPYHGGRSEILLGEALKGGYREKVYLATKVPIWLVRKTEHIDKYFNKQVKRLQTYPDLYLFHGLARDRLEKIKNLGLIKKMEELKNQDLIKYIGFSFHDNFETFKEIIDYYPWDCCQIQYNYLDINYQAGLKGLKYAASKNIAVIIMEPIRGGKLAIPENKLNTRPEIKSILDRSQIKRTMADWALQFVWNHPEVSVVLSGMSTMQQVIENIESANNSGINSLTDDELQTISELRSTYEKSNIVPCTSCGYCMPCPNGVDIPRVLFFINEIAYWGKERKDRILSFYNRMVKSQDELKTLKEKGEEVEGAAILCIQCGECLEKCPQQIKITDFMEKANAIFEEEKIVTEVLELPSFSN
ncbi:MAG: aldo/keto reductase [Candidatus Odinarchaeota archaeon]